MTRILRGLKLTSNAYRRNLRRHDKPATNPGDEENRETHQERSFVKSKPRGRATAARGSRFARTRRSDHRRHVSVILEISICQRMKLAKTRAPTAHDPWCRSGPANPRRSRSNHARRENQRRQQKCLSYAPAPKQSGIHHTILPTVRSVSYQHHRAGSDTLPRRRRPDTPMRHVRLDVEPSETRVRIRYRCDNLLRRPCNRGWRETDSSRKHYDSNRGIATPVASVSSVHRA